MADESSNGTFRVLVLEDEPAIKRAYERGFRSVPDIDVRYAMDVVQAKSILREGYSPDAIITDDGMPGMRGSDFILELRSSGFSGKIALASSDLSDSLGSKDSLRKKVEPHDVGCFYKPFRPGVLPEGLVAYLRTGEMPNQDLPSGY